MTVNRMARYEIFIGVWNTTGDVRETGQSPAGTLSATDIYRWLPGRHFILHEVDARFDGKPARSIEVMGYDTSRKHHFAQSYDDQGVWELFEVELKRRRWSITGAHVRFRGGFNTGGDRLTGLWELKEPRRGWRPWIDLELLRA